MRRFCVAMLILTGLALAGSDGDWFPWANCGGLGVFILGVCGLQGRKAQVRESIFVGH